MKVRRKKINLEGKKVNQMPGRCPICSHTLTVTRLQCGQCGTGIDGAFGLGRLQALTPEQVQFVEVFLKNKGKLKDVQDELDISYPTVVSRLNEIVRAMGYDVDEGDMSDVDRYEYYEAQVLKPQGGAPPHPAHPMHPAPPSPRIVPPPPPPVRSPRLSPEQRQKILDDIASGAISAAEAMEKLNG
jgi:hypothetical protein